MLLLHLRPSIPQRRMLRESAGVGECCRLSHNGHGPGQENVTHVCQGPPQKPPGGWARASCIYSRWTRTVWPFQGEGELPRLVVVVVVWYCSSSTTTARQDDFLCWSTPHLASGARQTPKPRTATRPTARGKHTLEFPIQSLGPAGRKAAAASGAAAASEA